jgi:hydroxymethylglutaryl-CoA lyase
MLKIIETPRDAMQGIKEFIPTKAKIEFINSLFSVGYHAIDVGSFVSPRAIPQMSDTAEVLNGIDISDSKTKVMVTVVNLRGAQRAMDFETIDEIAFPYSVSNEFLRRNINSDKQNALKTVDEIFNLCQKHNKELILYNSMAFGNAYGENWSPELVAEDTILLYKMGIKTIILSDTIDLGYPENIASTFNLLRAEFSDIDFGAHLHTTEMDWFSNLNAAWESGCRRFDSVINGLGGCPMSGKKLVGNLATTHLIEFLELKNQILDIDKSALNRALFLAATTIENHNKN